MHGRWGRSVDLSEGRPRRGTATPTQLHRLNPPKTTNACASMPHPPFHLAGTRPPPHSDARTVGSVLRHPVRSAGAVCAHYGPGRPEFPWRPVCVLVGRAEALSRRGMAAHAPCSARLAAAVHGRQASLCSECVLQLLIRLIPPIVAPRAASCARPSSSGALPPARA